MNATIDVERLDVMDFRVTVNDGGEPSRHTVIATLADHMALAPNVPIEDLVVESVRFLLAHETRSAVPDHFSLEEIAASFMDFEFEIKSRLGG